MTKKVFNIFVHIAFISAILFFYSCKNDVVDKETGKINQFIKNCFDDIYLWNENLPKVDINNEPDPYAFFDKLKYDEDYWSMLTDNVNGFNDNIAGSGLSYGYGLALYYKSNNSKEIIGVVKYVHPSTPAETHGLKRGDVLLKINGENINENNYLDLYYSSNITLGLGEYVDGMFVYTGNQIQMSAVKTYLNPIISYKIIEKEGYKIGYLHYTDYLLKSHQELSNIFSYFKNNDVTEIVLDLRYNGGGYALTSQYLCSMLVPENILNNREVYLKEIWNKRYMNYFNRNNKSTVKYFERSYSYENENQQQTDYVTVNMNLPRVYILISKNTASASEATIAGLKPYMQVITIGESTAGKFCGGIVLSPKDYEMNDKNIQNWGAYIMVYRYANNQNFPENTNRLEPDIIIVEDLLKNPLPLGDENEPSLAQAISHITGIYPSQTKAIRAEIKINYRSAQILENMTKKERMIELDFKK